MPQPSKIGGAGRKAEDRQEKRLKGRGTAASGASMQKGDIRFDAWLLETKSTVGDGLRITHDWLAKIQHEATRAGRHAALAVLFVDPQGRPKSDGAWVMIPESLWEELKDKVENAS